MGSISTFPDSSGSCSMSAIATLLPPFASRAILHVHWALITLNTSCKSTLGVALYLE